MNVENQNDNVSLSWFDKTKQQVQLWSEKFNINFNKIIEIATYFALGFFIGFLLKRFGRIFFISSIILIISLLLLDNFHIIQIDWIRIRDITGVSPQETVGSLFNSYFDWMKSNLYVVIGALVGVVLGYKVG